MNTPELIQQLEQAIVRAESYAQTAVQYSTPGNVEATAAYNAMIHVRAAREYAAELRARLEGAETVRQESEA